MMIMKRQILLACYICALSVCLSESSTQKSLGEVEALIKEYVDDLVNKDDDLRIASYEEEPRLFLGGLRQRGEKRDQAAGLWGREREQPAIMEEQNHTEDRTKNNKDNERTVKRKDSSRSEKKQGNGELWGNRQMDDLWEERETKKPENPGLWGKRATKGLNRQRKVSKDPQENVGLWGGKRGGKVFNPHNDGEDFGKRIRQAGKIGLWGRNRFENKSGRKRFSGRRKKTAYGR